MTERCIESLARGAGALLWLVVPLVGCIGTVDLGEGSHSSSNGDEGAGDSTLGLWSTSDASSGSSEDGPPVGEPCPDGVVPGDVVLATQAELDALAGCVAIAGSLTIVDDVESLAPLASLREIGVDLHIGAPEGHAAPSLSTLAGLEALEAVGGDLFLDSMEQLTTVEALAGLRAVPGSLGVSQLAALPSLEGLHGIERVDGALGISECPALVDLDGLRSVAIVGTHLSLTELTVTDFAGLDALTAVGTAGGRASGVLIIGNTDLVGLAGLDNVVGHDAHQVDITDNDALVGLGAFASASTLGQLAIRANDALAELVGLESLETVDGVLELNANFALAELDALAGLVSVGGFRVLGAQPLTDLSGLDALEVAGEIVIEATGLVDLGPLPALQTVGSVTLRENSALTDLSGLSGVTSVEALHIDNNDALVGLAALGALAEVGDTLDVRRNGALVSVDDLASLTTVGNRLEIVVNDALPQVDAESWAMGVSVGGVVKIDGNLGAPPPGDECPWVRDGECDDGGGLELCLDGTDSEDCPPGPPP